MLSLVVSVLFAMAISFVVAECFKSEGYLKVTQIIRFCIAQICIGMANGCWDMPFGIMVFFDVMGILVAILFIKDTINQQKVYPRCEDVPRQVLYKEDTKSGKCYILTDAEAKKASNAGETVYIHAIARVKYKSLKQENPDTKNQK